MIIYRMWNTSPAERTSPPPMGAARLVYLVLLGAAQGRTSCVIAAGFEPAILALSKPRFSPLSYATTPNCSLMCYPCVRNRA